ncbi:MAG: helix-turn-helix domain-containing protein [Gemmatimonadaceae bacterium]|nr:helix-turn-helix domain-containing protein [Gemmatimonadaceae bacterium]
MPKSATFGSRLHEFRKRARLTQKELAEAIDVDFTYISKIESGGAPPPARARIEEAAKILKLSITETDELFHLAEKIPANVEDFVAKQPATQRLLRSIRAVPVSEQAKLLEDLIKEAEKRHRK